MMYTTNSSSIVLFTIIISWLVSMSIGWQMDWVYLVAISLYFISLIITVFIQYTVSIENDEIRLVAHIFHLKLYRKNVPVSKMKKILFKRVGWAKKSALIILRTDNRFRFPYDSPSEAFDVLEQFAIKNNIEYKKTRDYVIVEKMAKNKQSAKMK